MVKNTLDIYDMWIPNGVIGNWLSYKKNQNYVYDQSKTNGSVYVCVFDERKTQHRRTILMAKSITLALKLAFKQPL